MVLDALRGYVQLASGLTEVTKQRAQAAAKALLQQTGADTLTSGLTTKASDLADEIVATSKSNRQLLQAIVTNEVEGAVARLGFVRSEEVAALTRRVQTLEGELAEARGTGTPAAPAAPAGDDSRKPCRRRSAAKKVAGRRRRRRPRRRRLPRRRRPRRRLPPRRSRPRSRPPRRQLRRRRLDVTEHPGEQFPPDVDPDVEPGFDPYPSEDTPETPDYDAEPSPQNFSHDQPHGEEAPSETYGGSAEQSHGEEPSGETYGGSASQRTAM